MRSRLMKLALVLVMAVALIGCASTTPTVSLDRVEVQNYFGYWFNTKHKPTEARGAPLVLAFVFNVNNTNDYAVKLDELKFTYSFDGYDMAMVSYTNPVWLAGGKESQVRVVSTMSTWTTFLNLMVTAGFEMKKQGVKATDLLEKWWVGVPDMSFPIEITNGTAQFQSNYGSMMATFAGKFGGK